MFYEESLDLTLEKYIEAILPQDHAIVSSLKKLGTIKNIYLFQQELYKLLPPEAKMSVLISCLYPDSPHKPLRSPVSAEEKGILMKSLPLQAEEMYEAKRNVDYFLSPIRQTMISFFLSISAVSLSKRKGSPFLFWKR